MKILTNADFNDWENNFCSVILYPVDSAVPLHVLEIEDAAIVAEAHADWWRLRIAKHLISCGVLFNLVEYVDGSGHSTFAFDPGSTCAKLWGGRVPPRIESPHRRLFVHDSQTDQFLEAG